MRVYMDDVISRALQVRLRCVTLTYTSRLICLIAGIGSLLREKKTSWSSKSCICFNPETALVNCLIHNLSLSSAQRPGIRRRPDDETRSHGRKATSRRHASSSDGKQLFFNSLCALARHTVLPAPFSLEIVPRKSMTSSSQESSTVETSPNLPETSRHSPATLILIMVSPEAPWSRNWCI